MAETTDDDRFRCDYCGQLAGLDRPILHWRHVERLSDGTDVYTSALYCSAHCGRRAVSAAGSGRG